MQTLPYNTKHQCHGYDLFFDLRGFTDTHTSEQSKPKLNCTIMQFEERMCGSAAALCCHRFLFLSLFELKKHSET